MKHLLTFTFLIVTLTGMGQNIKLPSILSDGVILQQNSVVKIWGWSNPSAQVKIVPGWSLKDTLSGKTDNNARFCIDLPTPSADGKVYSILFLGPDKKEIKNIRLGEVWLCSGQSNMEWTYHHGGLKDQQKEIAKANNPNISFFTTAKIASPTSQDDTFGRWEVCTSETMPKNSAAAYFFARQLQQQLNVPIGVVVSAWGGTNAEVWTPQEKIVEDDILTQAAAKIKEQPWWPSQAGVCYNKMIYPLLPFSFKGVIWYQGESNVPTAATYCRLMKTMVESWRRNFNQPLPFLYVQIAPHSGYDNAAAAMLREQQEQLQYEIADAKMVVISDLVDDVKNIHPANKMDVGARLANIALSDYYAIKNIRARYPRLINVEQVGKNQLLLSFENTYETMLLVGEADTPKGFSLFCQSDSLEIVNVRTRKEGVVIRYKSDKAPTCIQYCYDAASIGNLFNAQMLPVLPFRYDIR